MTVRILSGDVRAMLRSMEPNSVQCVVTSVPYFGLRSYDTEPQVWGGDTECAHAWGGQISERATNHTDKRRWQHTRNGRDEEQAADKRVAWLRTDIDQGKFCRLCNAWCGEHGLEPTVEMWLANEVAIWREIRRVLRKDGVAFLNVGDSYCSTDKWGGGGGNTGKNTIAEDGTVPAWQVRQKRAHMRGFKPKDRMMLPARLAISLQGDGWWLRDEIVWHKPNPMPSSTGDRTTLAHEMVYMLTRSARYFYDAVAIAEPLADSSVTRLLQPSIATQNGGRKQDQYDAFGLNERSGSRRPNEIIRSMAQKLARKPAGWDTGDGAHSTLRHAQARSSGNKNRKFGEERGCPDSHLGASVPWEGATKNKRSVWTIATEPYPDAHFATFPTKLVEPMILAGTSAKGACAKCGSPWRRVIEKQFVRQQDVSAGKAVRGNGSQKPLDATNGRQGYPRGSTTREQKGWQPSCQCECNETRPCLVLDSFGGSGTTGLVANRLGRDAVLIELNPKYVDMARARINADSPLFSPVEKKGPDAEAPGLELRVVGTDSEPVSRNTG